MVRSGDNQYERFARELARDHKQGDGDRIVHFFPDPDKHEIRFIEVTPNTPSSGEPMFFRFAPSGSVPFPMVVAEVTPDEWARLERDQRSLPEGWEWQARRDL